LSAYLTLLEAASVLGIHPDSLRRLVAAGRVPGATKWRDRQWLFERDVLAQFAFTYRAKPGRPPSGLFPELDRGTR
jgi:excisionase family DNA binding protein